MAILAMKCLRERPGPIDQLVNGITTRQIAYVKGKQDKDGGFDDMVATALAVQVTLSGKLSFLFIIYLLLMPTDIAKVGLFCLSRGN